MTKLEQLHAEAISPDEHAEITRSIVQGFTHYAHSGTKFLYNETWLDVFSDEELTTGQMIENYLKEANASTETIDHN